MIGGPSVKGATDEDVDAGATSPAEVGGGPTMMGKQTSVMVEDWVGAWSNVADGGNRWVGGREGPAGTDKVGGIRGGTGIPI